MLLARRLGYVQLAEPQRFTHVLGTRRHPAAACRGRHRARRLRRTRPASRRHPRGSDEQAYRGWLADHLDGKDTLLMARTEEQARELSRRARDDLIRYGLVADGPTIRLAQGEQASTGDLIMARRNTRSIQAGEDGRDLANRDVLQITRTTAGPAAATPKCAGCTGRDPATGQACWSAPFQIPARYLAQHATLAYATTCHAALGRTTSTAHVLVDGLGDRQGLYVAMSRGRDANHAYCVTSHPRAADTRPGSRPAPELDRTKRLDREHAALPAGPASSRRGNPRRPPGLRPRRSPRPRRQRTFRDRDPAPRTVPCRPPRHSRRHLGRPNPPRPSRQVRASPPWRAARRPRTASPGRPSLHLALADPPRSRSRRA